MSQWRTHTETWLSSEQQGLDDAADEAFAHVFAALPAVEPSVGFVPRAVDAAWRARGRRRRAIALAGLAVSVAGAGTAGAAAYGVLGMAGWLLTTIATVATSSAVSALMTAATAVDWWSAAARAGSSVTSILIMPQAMAAFVAIELTGAAALYLLHRLLRTEVRFRSPGPLCV